MADGVQLTASDRLAVEPILSYPHVAEFGKTYLLTVDLRPLAFDAAWPYAGGPNSEECVVYCLLNSYPPFRNEPLGEPVIVLHRFGGSYGPARFLLRASDHPQEGVLQVKLVNQWGVPLTVLETPPIRVQAHAADGMGSVEDIPRRERQVRPDRWVLVAGLGSYELPDKVLKISESLGAIFANEGYGLIVGGWPGVDHVVARKFVEVLTQSGRSDQEFLVQVVGPHGPDYPKGQVIRKQTYEEELTEAITRADVVVLISGNGATLQVGETARQEDKPVFPLADTDGDARKAYGSILDTWDRRPIRGISKEEFKALNNLTPKVIEKLMELIRKSIGATQMVQIGEVRFPKEDPGWDLSQFFRRDEGSPLP